MARPRGRILYRLLLGYLAIVCACILFVGLPLHLVLQRDYVANAAASLRDETAQLQPAIAAAIGRNDRARLDDLAARINAAFHGRVTIMREDGTVLGDSISPECSRLARPECVELIRAARSGAPIPSMSDTIALSAALAIKTASPVTVRLALPLEPMHAQVRRVNQLLLVGLGGAALLAVFVGLVLGRYIARPLTGMTRTAERIAGGDFTTAVPRAGDDEIGRLGDAINEMRGRLHAHVDSLAREHSRVLAIITDMSEAVLAVDAGGRIELSNAAAERLLAAPGRLPPGVPLDKARLPAPLVQAVRDVLAGGQARTLEVGEAGSNRHAIAATVAPVGGAGGAVVVGHDVTESRRVAGMGRELVANASHELRTPLATISSTVDTLLDRPATDAETRRFLEIIARHAAHLRRLVDATLQLSRIDAQQGLLRNEAVDVADLLAEAADAFAAESEARGQVVSARVEPEAATVHGDGVLLLQALRNLVDNAVRYTPVGGSIGLLARRDGGEVVIEVSDTGPGIAPAEQERVFDRFFRGAPAADAAVEGVGLGLSIVHRVAAAHGGRIELRSTPGEGSTFALHLPAPAPEPKPPA